MVREMDGVTVVRLREENLLSAPDVQRVGIDIGSLIDQGSRRIILDLKHVKYSGSSMLGMLIALNKKVAAAGGKLVLSHTESIDEMLTISRARKLFLIAEDPKVAMTMF